MSNEHTHSILLQNVLAVLDQLTQEEIRFLLSQCTEKQIALERLQLANKDAKDQKKPAKLAKKEARSAEAVKKAKNQYKNNYYRD
jgi:hypothetical protein